MCEDINAFKNRVIDTIRTNKETVDHIVSGCSKLAQKEYKRRHDCVARPLHGDLCQKHEIQTSQKWYEHQPKGVVETDSAKILWNSNLQTDNEIQARRPDIVIHNKSNKICFIIDEQERTAKALECQNESCPHCNWCTWDGNEKY